MTKILSLFTNEYDLAKAIQKGDRKAQNRFYEKYASKMLAVCSRYVGDKTEAEDVMIEGFMKIFDKINQFSFQGSFEGWVRKIIVNEALMYVRSKKNFNVDLEDAEFEIDTNEFATNLEAEELMKLIDQLPMGYKTVFNLFAIEGFSHQEIAEKLGISEGTSKSQLSRARVILQEKLQENESFNKRVHRS
jgi:RNA polymerase sigma factor (sigma-70 family)